MSCSGIWSNVVATFGGSLWSKDLRRFWRQMSLVTRAKKCEDEAGTLSALRALLIPVDRQIITIFDTCAPYRWGIYFSLNANIQPLHGIR
jgi:hypothetical protein